MKWIKRLFKLIVIAAGGFIAAFGLLLQTPQVKDYVKERIAAEAETYGYTVEMEDLSLLPNLTMTAHGLKVFKDGEEVVQVKSLSFTLSAADLVRQIITVKRFSVESDALPFPIHGSGRYGLAAEKWEAVVEGGNYLLQADGSSKSGSFSLHAENEQAAAGEFLLSDDKLIEFPSLSGFAGPLSVEGKLTLLKDHRFEDTQFDFHTPSIRGSAQIKGSIEKGTVSMKVQSGEKALEPIFDYTLTPSPKITASAEIGDLLDFAGSDSSGLTGIASLALKHTDSGWEGTLNLDRGEIENVESGALFSNISTEVTLHGSQIHLSNLTGTDQKGGSFRGNGTLTLDEEGQFPFTLDLELKKALLVNLDPATGTFNGKLNLSGNKSGAALKGNIAARSIKVSLSEKMVSAPAKLDVSFIEPASSDIDLSDDEEEPWPIELDLALNIPEKLSVKGRGLDSRWKGKLSIKGTAEEPEVYGEIEVVKGTFLLNNKTFDLTQGTLTFDGDPDKASLYVVATIEIDSKQFDVIVKGPLRNPNFAFRSNPPMDQKEILSWILFNRGTSSISEKEQSHITASLTSLSTGQGGIGPMTKFQKSLGIDKIDISGSLQGDTALKVGKYITKNTLLSVSRKLTRDPNRSSGANQFEIESDLTKTIKLQAEVGDDSSGMLNLIWKKHY